MARLPHSVCNFKSSNLCLREGSKQRGRSQSRFIIVIMMLMMVMVKMMVIIINPILAFESGYEETEEGGEGGPGGEPGKARKGMEEVGGGEGEGDRSLFCKPPSWSAELGGGFGTPSRTSLQDPDDGRVNQYRGEIFWFLLVFGLKHLSMAI